MAVLLVAATACNGSQAGDSGTGPSSATSAPPPSTVTLPPPTRRYQRPPQFVLVSFDGSGDPKLWRHWRAVGARTGARFSFFLSGVYLLDPAQRRLYHPPRHPPGSSDIGFSPTSATPRATRSARTTTATSASPTPATSAPGAGATGGTRSASSTS